MNRTKVINELIERYNLKKYLEIGVRDSRENFDLINIKNKIGVDPEPITPVKYKITSDEFFNINNDFFDTIFIDGLHTEEQSYVDVLNSIKVLTSEGFIVMHDCNPPTKYHARSYKEYLNTRGEWNGTTYKAFIRLRKELKDWNFFTVDCDFGCGILTKNKIKINNTIDLEREIDWDFFNDNRKELLNLISFEEYLKIIE